MDNFHVSMLMASACTFGVATLLVLVVSWARPSPEERFRDCMDFVERSGEFEPGDEWVRLVCLQSTFRDRSRASTPVPITVLPGMPFD